MSRVVIVLVVSAVLMEARLPLAARQATFRSGVDLVTVDATVLGGDGAPLASLGPDDVTLEVDGRPRRVVSAQFVSQAGHEARSIPLQATHFSSNEGGDAGRLVVVAVDEAHIRRLEGRPARTSHAPSCWRPAPSWRAWRAPSRWRAARLTGERGTRSGIHRSGLSGLQDLRAN